MIQTAVEWLANEFYEKLEVKGDGALFNDLVNQAKEMEKQQIIHAGNNCAIKQVRHNRKLDLMSLEELEEFALEETVTFGEEYYNETFKTK
jgi:hypothetical protein